jgi:flagellar biosynthesis protein FlhG
MLTSFPKNSKARKYLDKSRIDGSGPQRLYLPKLLPEIQQIDNVSYNTFVTRLEKMRPRLIINMVDEPKDADVAMKIRRSCEEYLALKIEHLGVVYRDGIQDTALSSRLPIVLYKPNSILSQAIYRIADKILSTDEGGTVLDSADIENSFQEAEVEAEVDFGSKMEYVEDLLHSGALSQGDLVETVKSQQLELAKIRKENNLLKKKLSQAIEKGFKA